MQIVDSKGKLFGRINVIDFFVFLFLLCIFAFSFYAFRIIMKRPASRSFQYDKSYRKNASSLDIPEIKLNFMFGNLDASLASKISPGDKEVDDKGNVIGEIVKVSKVTAISYRINTGEPNKVFYRDPRIKRVFVTIKMHAKLLGESLYYNGKKVNLKTPFVFKTNKYTVEGEYIGAPQEYY